MPVTWNAQADAKLLSGIIQVYDVKVSGEKLQQVAELMGDGCTPKALTHRISKIKSLAKSGETTANTGEEKGAGKKATGGAKGGKKGKRADTPVDHGEDDEAPAKGAKGSAKKRSASAGCEEGDEDRKGAKRFKTEPAEDGEDVF